MVDQPLPGRVGSREGSDTSGTATMPDRSKQRARQKLQEAKLMGFAPLDERDSAKLNSMLEELGLSPLEPDQLRSVLLTLVTALFDPGKLGRKRVVDIALLREFVWAYVEVTEQFPEAAVSDTIAFELMTSKMPWKKKYGRYKVASLRKMRQIAFRSELLMEQMTVDPRVKAALDVFRGRSSAKLNARKRKSKQTKISAKKRSSTRGP
jgi:hypothetical protein